jgi:hypothetical protein
MGLGLEAVAGTIAVDDAPDDGSAKALPGCIPAENPGYGGSIMFICGCVVAVIDACTSEGAPPTVLRQIPHVR